MKRLFTLLLFLSFMLCTFAQQPKFDPQKFMREQEAFITKEARLTPQEAAAFFPIFRELQDKKRNLYNSIRGKGKPFPTDDAAAEQWIAKMDKTELQIKKLEAAYHIKFCKVIPAMKVCKCIWAEDKFKRMTMDNLAKRTHRK